MIVLDYGTCVHCPRTLPAKEERGQHPPQVALCRAASKKEEMSVFPPRCPQGCFADPSLTQSQPQQTQGPKKAYLAPEKTDSVGSRPSAAAPGQPLCSYLDKRESIMTRVGTGTGDGGGASPTVGGLFMDGSELKVTK